MDKFIELELTLMNGDVFYICDRSFVVMEEHRHQQVGNVGDDVYHKITNACSVNGYSVMETHEDVIAMIRKAKNSGD